MAKKPKHQPEPEPDIDDQLEDLYEQAMADIYDIMIEGYDKIGVRVKELMEAVQYAQDEIEVELDDDDHGIDD